MQDKGLGEGDQWVHACTGGKYVYICEQIGLGYCVGFGWFAYTNLPW